jgi:hypothetical protein
LKPQVDLRGLSKPKAWEHALRFLFGGTVALVAGLTSQALGDFAGGLALAFPAILPAALTLVNVHDGRSQAVEDARGARFGALGLTAFALVVLLGASAGPCVALPLALLFWIIVAGGSWWLGVGRRTRDS